MKNCIVLVAAVVLLEGCSPPVMFAVNVDETIHDGTLTLNGNSAKLMRNIEGAYWAKWEGSDASGFIEIRFPDGESARCEVGYVTHGMTTPVVFEVRDRKCFQVRYD